MGERHDSFEDDDLEPLWRPPGLPEEHARLGLTRNTVEGAWLELAANLDPRRPFHLAVAWLALAIFVVPVLLTLLQLFR